MPNEVLAFGRLPSVKVRRSGGEAEHPSEGIHGLVYPSLLDSIWCAGREKRQRTKHFARHNGNYGLCVLQVLPSKVVSSYYVRRLLPSEEPKGS
jgi:hypothetical protein